MSNNIVSGRASIVLSKNAFAEICIDENSAERFIRSVCKFKSGAIITPFKAAEYFNTPNTYTVQLGEDKHVSLYPVALHYTNHSCDPNVFFDTNNMNVVAIKDIEPGDLLCFFYPSTEWKMASPFVCGCGSDDCLGNIDGAANISKEILSRYRLSDFISEKLFSSNKL